MGRKETPLIGKQQRSQLIQNEVYGKRTFTHRAGLEMQKIPGASSKEIATVEIILKESFDDNQLRLTCVFIKELC